MLLVLLLLKLLGQLQVAKTQGALRLLLLLQGQGDQVVLQRGKERHCEVACGLGGIWARFRFPNQFFLILQLLQFLLVQSITHSEVYLCGDREYTPSVEMVPT